MTGLCMASAAAGAAMLGVSYADGGVRLWDTGSRACVREMKEQVRAADCGDWSAFYMVHAKACCFFR